MNKTSVLYSKNSLQQSINGVSPNGLYRDDYQKITTLRKFKLS